MSVENLVISAIVEEGTPALRRLYSEGVSSTEFVEYAEEFNWIEQRAAERRPVNLRVFTQRFPKFDYTPPVESLKDLAADLKQERAFAIVNSLVQQLSDELEVDNAVVLAEHARDVLAEATRLQTGVADVRAFGDWRDHIAHQDNLRKLRDQGQPPGVPSYFKHLNYHWDGHVPGRFEVVLGRPGDGKSYFMEAEAWAAVKNNLVVLMFSPEMSPFEHRCRFHTIASGDPDVKEATGLRQAFRNRALMNGIGYNVKAYRTFLEYMDSLGEIILLTKTHRRQRMTPQFIASKIEEFNPDFVIVDPIYKLKPTSNARRDNPFHDIAEIADDLQDIAVEYNIPVLCSNQGRRQGNTGGPPGKNDSFNSDVPIQEGAHVIGVKHISEERVMTCYCSKSRFGMEFRFDVRFFPNIGLMRELDEPQGNYYNGSDDPDVEEVKEMVRKATGKVDA